MKFGYAAAAAAVLAFGVPVGAQAQTKLKFAHVYEINEPYHTEMLWAAQEIAKRTNNKYTMDVFPASQLGNEPAINQALPLGTIDIIYTGTTFVGNNYKPIAISNAPYMFRDFAHWEAYAKSDLFKELAAGYDKVTSNKIVVADLLRRAPHDRQQGDQQARRHEGHEAAHPAGAALPDVRHAPSAPTRRRSPSPKSIWRCRTRRWTARKIRCRRSRRRSSTRCRRHIKLTEHMLDNLVTVIGGPTLEQAQRPGAADLRGRLQAGRRTRDRRDPQVRSRRSPTGSRARASRW